MGNKMDVDDFSNEDFNDPIALLSAIQSANKKAPPYVSEEACESELLTIDQILKEYNITEEFINAAVQSKKLKPARCILEFSRHDIDSFLGMNPEPSLFHEFMYEIENMRINYSYKPVFILSLLDMANAEGVVNLSDIVVYFLAFYNKRSKDNLIVEKNDSSFVKYFGNYAKAQRTILTYPLKIYQNKGLIKYDSESMQVTVPEAIWFNLTPATRTKIEEICLSHIALYFNDLS